MVWGDFQGSGNVTLAGSLLRYQKRIAGLVAEKRGRYHADPLLAQYGIMKVGDLYRQQLRVHAWRFQKGLLPRNQAAMLTRAADLHGHATRSSRRGLAVTVRDHRVLGYRVPKEWATLTEEQRGLGSLAAFKRASRAGFLADYAAFVCTGDGCWVCQFREG